MKGARTVWLWAVLFGLCLGVSALVSAEQQTIDLEAILIWATNGAKPPDKDLKLLDPDLAARLRKAPYKWRNYFEVERKWTNAVLNATTHLPISQRCRLEIKYLGSERVSVNLIGKGKEVSKQTESLPPGHVIILGGDDNNDTAWLIVLRQNAPGAKR